MNQNTDNLDNTNKTKLLAVARELAQTLGINAFSYRDLSERVGIKTASIHYYFPKKEDLAMALIRTYRIDFATVREEIEAQSKDAKDRIFNYISRCMDSMEGGIRICLCGMLATDFITLSELTQGEVKKFIKENENWLEAQFKEANKNGQLTFSNTAKAEAQILFGMIEGIIITSHCFTNEENRLMKSNKWIKSMLEDYC